MFAVMATANKGSLFIFIYAILTSYMSLEAVILANAGIQLVHSREALFQALCMAYVLDSRLRRE